MGKWKPTEYKSYNSEKPPKFINWRPPPLIYPCSPSEKDALNALKDVFDPLPPYEQMEAEAIEQETVVSLEIPIPEGHIAFLENTAERCTSPTTKHSQEGMQGARHWVQRVDTPEGMFRRLTDGYGVSLMFGERCHQYIRNSNNWRGINGVLLDIDVFRDEKHPDAPEPVFSLDELFDRYPRLPEICSFILPSASSLHDGRPFKARGGVLFPQPITDQRVYRKFGERLLQELDCIPANVTKNPVAVGFGNTHNAPQVYRNSQIDTAWIADHLQEVVVDVRAETKQRNREQKQKAKRKKHYQSQRNTQGESSGENISAFIEQCDPVAEMVRSGLLTRGRGNEYRWHESEHDRSCDIVEGSLHIFSHSMFDASPHQNINEAVGAHRFYLYQLSGLDMTRDADKPRIREFLFERGYGSDPKVFGKKQQKQGIRKPVKLFKSEYAGVLQTLDTARAFLKDVFAKGSKFFAIRTDTGTGKTETGLTYAMTKDVVMPTLSHTLSSEIVHRGDEKEIYAYGYKGIGYHPEDSDASYIDGRVYDADGYMSCIQPTRFEIVRNRGFNAYKWVCDNCPVYLECKAVGYLSQPDRARAAQLVALPFPPAFLDPRLRSWADLYKPSGRDALILHDDLPLGSLFIEYRLKGDRLRRIHDEWKGTLAAEWAEAVLSSFSLRDWEYFKSICVGMSTNEKESVRYALTQCIDPATGAVVEPDDYLKSEWVDFSTDEACLKLPQVDKEGFHISYMLETFFKRYPRVEDAPFYYEKETESFVFYLPPKPYIFNKTVKFGFASATLEKKLIQAILPDIAFFDAGLTEWVEGGGVFQLRTNRNPRATVLNFVEKYTPSGDVVKVWDGLNTTGETYYQSVLDFIKAYPNEKHAVLSYKVVIQEKQSELDALGVATAHFGDIAGLDAAFKGVKYFHILFCPFTDPEGIELLVKEIFGSDPVPLIRDADGNLQRNEDGTYADERAQLCHDVLVLGELRQVVGRARLNLYANRVFLWTSLFIDGISNREETILFDEVDWQQSENDTEKLHDLVAKRERAEQTGDVKSVMEATGKSQSQAYDDTKAARQQAKTERDAQVIALHQQERNASEIHRETGIPRSTVVRILKEFTK